MFSMKSRVVFAVVAILLAVALVSSGSFAQQPPRPEPLPPPPDVAAPPADAQKTASGLAFKVLEPAKSETRPGAKDAVTVHYSAWTTDGKMFDSSHVRKMPSTFLIENVIKGWGEGVQLMTVGEKRRFWIPEEIAFRGLAGRPKGMVVFDVELLDVTPDPRVAPADVAKPPADAQKTPSGIAYKVLRPGTGTVHPQKQSGVTVHYTGWATDGKMFDSSVVRGAAATFGLDQVIEGWTEGVQLMVVGEKTRFWIPARLAYQGRNGPQGMLVFDIDLLAIR
jgi:FKBP-type peptidyl-prolyl cis-trans isomerase